jgi:hypothetical protein
LCSNVCPDSGESNENPLCDECDDIEFRTLKLNKFYEWFVTFAINVPQEVCYNVNSGVVSDNCQQVVTDSKKHSWGNSNIMELLIMDGTFENNEQHHNLEG